MEESQIANEILLVNKETTEYALARLREWDVEDGPLYAIDTEGALLMPSDVFEEKYAWDQTLSMISREEAQSL